MMMVVLSKKRLAAIERSRKAALRRIEITNHLKQIESIGTGETLVLVLSSNRQQKKLKLPTRLRSYGHQSNVDKAIGQLSGCQYIFRQKNDEHKLKLAKRYQNPFLLP